jgi:hypothetical protein
MGERSARRLCGSCHAIPNRARITKMLMSTVGLNVDPANHIRTLIEAITIPRCPGEQRIPKRPR